MKNFKVILCEAFIFSLALTNIAFCQWLPNGNDIYFNTGNVGVGLTTPLHLFDVGGDINSYGTVFWNNGKSRLSPDQGGSIILGDGLNIGAIPYIDFHYGIGSKQPWNYRIINEGDNLLSFRNSSNQKIASITNTEFEVFQGGSETRQLDLSVRSNQNYTYGSIAPWDPTPGAIMYLVFGGYKVGVNTGNTAPIQDFDVAGRLRVGNGVIQNGSTTITSTSDLGLYSQNNNWMRFVTNQEPIRFFTTLGPDYKGDDNDIKMTIQPDGNVGIGTGNPDANYKLSVNGKIRSKEIRVETGWSDFVFKPEYKLNSLDEVEKYIKENGHLEGIPTGQQVSENGVELGDATSKLLSKIEELTLYMIEQNKRIENLERENNELRDKK